MSKEKKGPILFIFPTYFEMFHVLCLIQEVNSKFASTLFLWWRHIRINVWGTWKNHQPWTSGVSPGFVSTSPPPDDVTFGNSLIFFNFFFIFPSYFLDISSYSWDLRKFQARILDRGAMQGKRHETYKKKPLFTDHSLLWRMVLNTKYNQLSNNDYDSTCFVLFGWKLNIVHVQSVVLDFEYLSSC